MKREYIYVIMRHTGCYEDAQSDTVCALRGKAEADDLARRMREQAEKVIEKLRKISDAYFAESDDLVDTPKEKAWRKYSDGKGTALDRDWIRRLDTPTYGVDKLLVRKVKKNSR